MACMAGALSKAQVERRVFERLAPLAGYRVAPDSIRQDPPPAPDIECEVVGEGVLAVELVALDHESTRTRLSNMFSTREAWDRALGTRPSWEKIRLSAECENVFLSLLFDESAGSRSRRDAICRIQDHLLALGPAFDGSVFADAELPAGLHDAVVHRGHVTKGPQISAPSAGYWLPPQIDKIREKLTAKRYQTTGPLDLFAYATHDEPDGAVGLREQIDLCVRTHLPGSGFRRVYVFHVGFGQLIYRYPP